jgi:hypothetical protein
MLWGGGGVDKVWVGGVVKNDISYVCQQTDKELAAGVLVNLFFFPVSNTSGSLMDKWMDAELDSVISSA